MALPLERPTGTTCASLELTASLRSLWQSTKSSRCQLEENGRGNLPSVKKMKSCFIIQCLLLLSLTKSCDRPNKFAVVLVQFMELRGAPLHVNEHDSSVAAATVVSERLEETRAEVGQTGRPAMLLISVEHRIDALVAEIDASK